MKSHTVKAIIRAACFCAVALPGPFVQASDTGLTIDALKNNYMDCERRAVQGKLTGDEFARCSKIYEELKRRAFGGSYRDLKVWWDAQSGLIEPEGLRRI